MLFEGKAIDIAASPAAFARLDYVLASWFHSEAEKIITLLVSSYTSACVLA